MAVSLFKILGEVFIDDQEAIKSMNNIDKKAEDTSKNGLSKVTDAANKVGKVLMAAGAGVIAGATALVVLGDKSASTASSMKKLSTQTQMNLKDTQEWAYVFTKMGSSTDTMTGAINKLGITMGKADDDNKRAKEAFKDLGISIESANGKLKPSGQLFQEAMTKLAGMKDATERNIVAQKLFGGSYQELLPILNKGAQGIEDLKTRANQLGKVMSDDEVNAGAKYKKSMADLKEELGSLGTRIGNELMPYFGKAADWLNQNSPKITEFIDKVVKVLGDTIAFVSRNGTELSIVLGTVFTAVMALNAIKTIQEIMTAWNTVVKVATTIQKAWNLAMEMNPIGLVILSITALIAIGVLLYKNWDTVSAKLKVIWQGIATVAKTVFGALGEIVKAPINSMIKLLNGFIDGINKVKIPDWVPLVGGKGINLPHIPMLAKGTDYFQGGYAIVGEKGPELVEMPKGSKVNSNDKTQKILNNGITLTITNFYNNRKEDIEELAQEMQFYINKRNEGVGGAYNG